MVIIVNNGSSQEVEIPSEQKLSRSRASSLRAIGETYTALSRWHDALEKDAIGELDAALEYYEETLQAVAAARNQWQIAERRQSEVIEYLLGTDENLTIRDEVIETLDDLDPEDHVEKLKQEGFIPDVPLGNVRNLVTFGRNVLGLQEVDPVISSDDHDEALQELLELYQLDLRARLQMKVKLANLYETLEDAKPQVENGRLFESTQVSTHRGDGRYSYYQASGEIHGALQSYELFRMVYGMYNTRATENADTDVWPEIEQFGQLDTLDPTASNSASVSRTDDPSTQTVAEDD